MGDSTPLPNPAAIARAELFTREQFVYEGESLGDALAPGSARRRALDAALVEIDAGTTSAIGRLAAPLLAAARARAAALRGRAAPRRRHGPVRASGRCAIGDPDRAARRRAAQRVGGQWLGRQWARSRGASGDGAAAELEPAELASSAIPGEELELELELRTGRPRRRTRSPRTGRTPRPSSTRTFSSMSSPRTPTPTARFWFEHATGAGKTVAALGFVEASRTGGS